MVTGTFQTVLALLAWFKSHFFFFCGGGKTYTAIKSALKGGELLLVSYNVLQENLAV